MSCCLTTSSYTSHVPIPIILRHDNNRICMEYWQWDDWCPRWPTLLQKTNILKMQTLFRCGQSLRNLEETVGSTSILSVHCREATSLASLSCLLRSSHPLHSLSLGFPCKVPPDRGRTCFENARAQQKYAMTFWAVSAVSSCAPQALLLQNNLDPESFHVS